MNLYINVPSDAYKLHVGTSLSTGYDIKAYLKDSPMVIPSGSRGIISTGLHIQSHKNATDLNIHIASRSGLALNHGIQAHSGIIDMDYTGEIKILLFNHGDKDFMVNDGDRIAQLIIGKCIMPSNIDLFYINNDKLMSIRKTRNSSGFGSTGI